MKILIITDTYEPEINGVVTSIKRFSSIMAQKGHHVYIFTAKYNGEKDKPQKNLEIKRFYSLSFLTNKEVRFVMPSLLKLVLEIKRIKPDVVHIQTPMMLGVSSILALRMLKMNHIETYHSYIPDMMVYFKFSSLPGIKKLAASDSLMSARNLLESEVKLVESDAGPAIKLVKTPKDKHKKPTQVDVISDKVAWEYTRRVYNQAKLVITPSDALRKELVRHGIKSKVVPISNGIDSNFFTKKTDYRTKYRMLHVGRLGYEKSVEVVLAAFNIAHKKNPRLRLDIIGDGPARESLEKKATRMDLGDTVRFFGFVKTEAIQKAYARYDFFVTASTMETQGLVILEAMSVGIAALGVRKLAVPELIKNGVNGYISAPGDAAGMARNMLKMYEVKGRIEELGKRGMQTAALHDISKCADELEKVYKEFQTSNVKRQI